MSPVVKNLVVLSDEEIKESVLKNADIVNRFQFLRPAKMMAESLGTCAPCQRGSKGKQLVEMIHNVQQQIATMSNEHKTELKTLLGAKNVRLFYKANKNGVTIRERLDF